MKEAKRLKQKVRRKLREGICTKRHTAEMKRRGNTRYNETKQNEKDGAKKEKRERKRGGI